MSTSAANSSSNEPAYQSDHNPVYGYFPGLIDNKYNVAIFTYNEKGQTTTPDAVNDFLNNCAKLLQADVVIIGIQEGDNSTVFVNTVINRVSKSEQLITGSNDNSKPKNHPPLTLDSHPILTNPPRAPLTASQHKRELEIFSTSYGNAVQLAGANLGNQNNITSKAITYKSFGKECKSGFNKVCLLNGLYVLIRHNLVDILNINPDYGTKTLNSIPFFSKHIAWACIESADTKSQYVFFSCHLEYNGSKSNAPTGFKYPQRKAQLDSYISSMTTKFPDAKFIMCLGDTNMRTFFLETGVNQSQRQRRVYDQMLQYLLQLNPELIANYKLFNKINAETYIQEINDEITNYINTTTLYKLIGCEKQDNGTNFSFCVVDKNESPELLVKVNALFDYRNSKTPDIYAPYCINPAFQLGNTTYRAYDFTYTPENDNTSPAKLYAYPPTAIYKLTYPREFDMAKREKSGNILATSHTDRILMFRPVRSTGKKINFMLLE